ncbi:phosphatase PAP2 family protein [Zhongshania borealis]|uniref:phosphatase PAP2 family protein n=1 Tax=Zhongshania borealis TaxID=889488 RepID=UPI0031ED6537
MSPTKHVLWSLCALIVITLCFELSNLDLWVQNFLYDRSSQEWLLKIDGHPWRHFFFYNGPKRLLPALELALVVSLLFFRKHRLIQQYHQGLLIVLIALPLGPAVVSSLKATTNVACPYALSQYGGEIPYIKIFESYPLGEIPEKQQRCFPAGHASGGFALLALYYLPKAPRRRRQMLGLALAIGWSMGAYKMLLGHHFTSHTIISMVLCWLVVNCIALMVTPHKATPPNARQPP